MQYTPRIYPENWGLHQHEAAFVPEILGHCPVSDSYIHSKSAVDHLTTNLSEIEESLRHSAFWVSFPESMPNIRFSEPVWQAIWT